jgi:ABC-type transport system substrate-binding protein
MKTTPKPLLVPALLALSLAAAPATAAAGGSPSAAKEPAKEKVLNMPIRTAGPGSVDPVRGSTVYDNQAVSLVYETLLQYKYLKRPLELEPLLLAEMPATEDGVTWHFRLKEGVRFQDDPCFEGGKGREVVASDVFYSMKRMADNDNDPKSWWLYEDTIVGFDQYRDAQNAAERFDYDAGVEGMKPLGDHEFQIVLTRPVFRFMWVLAMFQTSVVPREAVETYGTRFGRHPVGTGPYRMREEDWIVNKSMTFTKSPTFRDERYPAEHMPEDVELGFQAPAGQRLPFLDRVVFTMFVQDQPMWLEFRSGKLDYTQVPAENFLEAFHKRSQRVKKEYAEQGIAAHAVPLLDFIFRGFNMEDPVVGGYGEKQRMLRQALSLAVDLHEFNDTFYNGTNIVYDGMIPPGLDGYPEGGRGPVSFMGPDLDRARELLAKAGYPGGKGLPTIEYYSSRAGNIPEQTELLKRQLGKIGVQLNVRLLNFAELIEAINLKKAPLFSFAWSSDYPDGENNLALFYGPNESPGSNHFNYESAEFDELYRQVLTMQPSPERTALFAKMRDMVIRDVPYIGSMARTRFYLVQPWLKNFKPSEDFYNWVKYLDLDESERP